MTNLRHTGLAEVPALRLLRTAGWLPVMLIYSACPAVGQSHSAILAWDRSESHTNLAAYIIKYGTSSGIHTGRVDVATNVATATVANLVAGRTYFFVVIARSVSGLESYPSAETSYTFPIGNISRIAVTSQGVVLRLAGIPGLVYTIERSADLKSWAAIAVMTAPLNGVFQFTDPNPLSQTAFYRMAVP